PTAPVEHRGGVEIPGAAVPHVGPSQQGSQLLEMSPIARPREHFQEDGITDGDLRVKQSIDLLADRRAGAAQEFHPGRAIDEDQGVPRRVSRISAKSPSQPDPLSWRASSTVVSAASRRRAKLTAARLLV